MKQIMFYAELETPEFAYMLALVDARAIVGVDDPELFPLDDPLKDSVYSMGQESLGAHGWLRLVKESPNEYDLDPLLFKVTAIIAAPEIVVATMRDAKGVEGRLVQHYVAGDEIVELSVTVDRKYRIGVLSEKNALYERMGRMLNLETPPRSGHFTLDEPTFISIQGMCQEGELEEAVELLTTTGVNGELGTSFVEALSSPSSGQVVVIRPRSGEIEAGRRAMVFGEGNGAWMLVRTTADSKEFEAASCNPDSLGVLISEWQKELMTAG